MSLLGSESAASREAPAISPTGAFVAQQLMSDATAEISERQMREFVKAQIPRLVKSRVRTLLVEEMEVCSGRARVDLAIIGDQLIGIEIKGPRDDVVRLPGQVKAYSRCFDRVVLVVHETLVRKAIPLIPDWWGIVIGQQSVGGPAYRFARLPQRNPGLDLDALLSLLWRDEIEGLLANLLGGAPKPRATKRTIRAELLSVIEPRALRSASLEKLRSRIDWRSIPVHG